MQGKVLQHRETTVFIVDNCELPEIVPAAYVSRHDSMH